MISYTNILNLEASFAPLGPGLQAKIFTFPSGSELGLKLLEEPRLRGTSSTVDVLITCRIKSSDDILKLLLATDALRRAGATCLHLLIPFLPYARQDRVMVEGEPLSIKVFADIINSQNYERVYVYDAHSDVGPALINNCVNCTNHKFVKRVLDGEKDYFLVAPDAGALKKVAKLSEVLEYKQEIIFGSKVRDLATGKLTKFVLTSAFPFTSKPRKYFIVDDICDGGATFVQIAETLRRIGGVESINLIVSHGIFSKGLPIRGIDHVFTTNSFNEPPNTDYVTVSNIDHGLLSQ